MIRKVYIDNSVIGGVFDEEWEYYSKLLFDEFKQGLYVPVISNVVLVELEPAPKRIRQFFDEYQDLCDFIEVNDEIVELADAYLKEGKFSQKMREDSLHIALASANKIDVLVSWNFAHIVNLDRIHIYNAVNLKFGYPPIEIRSPREIIHEKEI